jgi:hypothetical protein
VMLPAEVEWVIPDALWPMKPDSVGLVVVPKSTLRRSAAWAEAIGRSARARRWMSFIVNVEWAWNLLFYFPLPKLFASSNVSNLFAATGSAFSISAMILSHWFLNFPGLISFTLGRMDLAFAP